MSFSPGPYSIFASRVAQRGTTRGDFVVREETKPAEAGHDAVFFFVVGEAGFGPDGPFEVAGWV